MRIPFSKKYTGAGANMTFLWLIYMDAADRLAEATDMATALFVPILACVAMVCASIAAALYFKVQGKIDERKADK